jgi:hypothetical protein
MSISCDPQSLVSNASCFSCITGDPKEWVKLYLLRHIAGLDAMTPQDLLAASACMTCVPPGMFKAVETYLLCQIANQGACEPQFEGTPANVDLFPEVSVGVISPNNSYVGITSLTIRPPTFGDFTIQGAQSLLSASFPNLVTVGHQAFFFGSFKILGCPVLASISAPMLNVVADQFVVANNPLLTSVNFPKLTSVQSTFDASFSGLTALNLPLMTNAGGDFLVNANPGLATLSFPNLIFTVDGSLINFNGCALTAASVNHILARCMASGLTSANINLQGGTSAAPTGQGVADKAALIAAGNNVTTN